MDTLNATPATPELGVRASRASPVVIATDGRAQSDSALVVGRLFAGSLDAARVVTVMKSMPILPDSQITVSADIHAARRADARRVAMEQLARAWGGESDVELGEGDPATVIARLAHETGATMIVAGLGRHRVADRIFGDETALRLIRVSDVPVFSTASGMNHAPRRIVVAIDFSETGLRAARMALDLAASGATIYLTHVAPRDSSLYDWKGGAPAYKQDASRALQKTREQLHVPSDIVVQRALLQGDPATELLAFAASVNADLIATGSHGHGFVARMLIGSVTTRIVRCSTCSVLTVPYAAIMTDARTTVEPTVVASLPRPEWQETLDVFSKRNAGRRCTVEVDDPEIGAQQQASDVPFLGTTFDPHDQRVELMLGDNGDGTRHLTRDISGVTAIDVMREEGGRDVGLRIAHGTGQTMLTLYS